MTGQWSTAVAALHLAPQCWAGDVPCMSSAGDASAKNNCKNGIWWKICLFAGRPALHCWFMQWSSSAARRSLQRAALGLAAGHPAHSCHTCSMGAPQGREWQPGPVPPPARSRQPGALGQSQPRVAGMWVQLNKACGWAGLWGAGPAGAGAHGPRS